MTISNILLILFFLIIFLILLFLLILYPKQNKRPAKKIINIPSSIPLLKDKELNPDISTDNWDLHKLRLEKFKRSQYKGLTFFVSAENRIYYLSEKGARVYC